MRSLISIIADTFNFTCEGSVRLLTFIAVLFLAIPLAAQRIAVLTPEKSDHAEKFSVAIGGQLKSSAKMLDSDMAETAFRSLSIAAPFNMTVSEARSAAAVIGTDYFVLVRAGSQRRTSLSRADYYEAFAFLFLIDGRSGRMISWKRTTFESDSQIKADAALAASVDTSATDLLDDIRKSVIASSNSPPLERIEEVPAEGSPAARDLKAPIPYKRIKPAYTDIAFLYDVQATVEVEVDIGADGQVIAERIVRWSGFDLERSVETAVRSMNWRPAMRNNKPLPMRILLRYNFTKVDKDR